MLLDELLRRRQRLSDDFCRAFVNADQQSFLLIDLDRLEMRRECRIAVYAQGLDEFLRRDLLEAHFLSKRSRKDAGQFDMAHLTRASYRDGLVPESAGILKNLYDDMCNIDSGNGHEAAFWVERSQISARTDERSCV